MCTVTVVPHERGVRLVCNRDEQRTRPTALSPRVYDLGERRAVFPVDPRGGGTWVGVNDIGLAAALLNVQRTAPAIDDDQPKQSRGLVVRELLRSRSLTDAAATVTGLNPHALEPFRVVILHENGVAVVAADETASMRCTRLLLDRPLLFTSSSLGQMLVEPPRQRLFDRMVVRNRNGWLEGQARFHDHQWRRRPEISVRMERRDALTVSRTTIDITNDTRQLSYEALGADSVDRARECCSLR